MSWPATLDLHGETVRRDGTVYVKGMHFPKVLRRHKPSGQAWKYRETWTTYCPSRSLIYKNVDRLKTYGEEDFWNIMQESERSGITPPTSFADMFTSVFKVRMPRASLVFPFRLERFGGWQQVIRGNLHSGAYEGKVYHYDLNRAYRWSAMQGLPDMSTAYWTSDRYAKHAVYLTSLPRGVVPYHHGGLTMITSEERDHFNLHDRIWPIYGLGFRKFVSLVRCFNDVDTKFPTSSKRISRSFWGLWNTREAPIQVSWKHGEKSREMHNPFFNPIWSSFITSRIKLRLASVIDSALHIYVDSVHSTVPLPTGNGDGEWRLDGEYNDAWFRSPGHWGSGAYTLRHSGVGSTLFDNGLRAVV